MPKKNTPNRPQANRAAYLKCQPRQLGDLHERTKYLVALVKRIDRRPGDAVLVGFDWNHLRWAAFDLETEAQFYKPRRPPYGATVKSKSANISS